MKEGLLIGGSIIVAGVFVGFAAYTIVKKKPKLLKKTSAIFIEAKQAFAEGFKGAQTKKVATA